MHQMHTNDHKRISKETNLPRDCASSVNLCRQATSAGWSDRLGNELKIPDRLTHPRGWTWTLLQISCTIMHSCTIQIFHVQFCMTQSWFIYVHLSSSCGQCNATSRNISQHLAASANVLHCQVHRFEPLWLWNCGPWQWPWRWPWRWPWPEVLIAGL